MKKEQVSPTSRQAAAEHQESRLPCFSGFAGRGLCVCRLPNAFCSSAPEEIQRRVLQDVLVLEDKFSEVEVEEARGGEKGEKSGGAEVSDTSRVDVDRRTMSGTHIPDGVAGSDGATGRRCSRELRIDLRRRAFEGNQGSVGQVRRNRRQAGVRRESADTLENEAFHLNGMDVDMDKNKEELTYPMR